MNFPIIETLAVLAVTGPLTLVILAITDSILQKLSREQTK